ncbi:MAG: hypothetical protein FXF47_00575 [Candidatus Mcinerneyibacterium aminivorans]|uniref:Uncharacterized protein n=1 Tax=Candidatus Mcinerneyibacterium aminivorans TaxID=2703815 RepID=A0A5D0MKP6_9BACT|nr:MAG: hypothetical protein FXF47_00575 [Candidatus Mcinerneyibacterium aminivorans]
MRKIVSLFLITGIIIGFIYSQTNLKKFKLMKKSQKVFKTPESIKYDPARKVIYVSNINGAPTERDGNGFISKLNEKGEVIDLKWITGLDAPKGMGIYKNYLYVTNIYEVVKIDIESERIIKRIDMGGEFLNDIDVDEVGNVYVSDMTDKKIYKIDQNNNYTEYFKNQAVKRPNGLRVLNNYLYIGSAERVFSLDLKSKELIELSKGFKNTDGIVFTKDNNLIASNFNGELFYYDFKKKTNYSQKLKHGSADIGIIRKKNILLVPDFDKSIYFYWIK